MNRKVRGGDDLEGRRTTGRALDFLSAKLYNLFNYFIAFFAFEFV
jgi:hypothetical protein